MWFWFNAYKSYVVIVIFHLMSCEYLNKVLTMMSLCQQPATSNVSRHCDLQHDVSLTY